MFVKKGGEGMKKLGKQVWGWALYDWANSAFATTVMAGFFPIFLNSTGALARMSIRVRPSSVSLMPLRV